MSPSVRVILSEASRSYIAGGAVEEPALSEAERGLRFVRPVVNPNRRSFDFAALRSG